MKDSEQLSHEPPSTVSQRRDFLRGALATAGLLACPQATSRTVARVLASAVGGQAGLSSAAAMADVAQTFLRSLSPDQVAKALYKFEDDGRLAWNFRPRVGEGIRSQFQTDPDRVRFLATLPTPRGIPIRDLDPRQRQAATDLLRSGLSDLGLTKATQIMNMDLVVRELDRGFPVWDPEAYSVTLFGKVGAPAWSWSFEGHHISLNYTIVNNREVSSAPSFLGVVPALVPDGPTKGLRVLAAEEDLGRKLLKTFDGDLRRKAVIAEEAPHEILSGITRKFEPLTPAGLQASLLSNAQSDILIELMRLYAGRVPPDLAASRLDRIRSAGMRNIYFAWAGGAEPGLRHYYRIQGDSFLIEYDNSQNNGNHIHTVWRDFAADFGQDLLARHYREAHR
jgi:hypothetical protein